MDALKLRIDEPGALRSEIAGANGRQVAIGIPVYAGRESRDVAASVRDATFICEQLAEAFKRPTVAVTRDPSDPNSDLVVLSGVVTDTGVVTDFVTEWFETLDPNGDGEPFVLTSNEFEDVSERLEGDEKPSAFRFPELAKWYREVRSHFEEWDEGDE